MSITTSAFSLSAKTAPVIVSMFFLLNSFPAAQTSSLLHENDTGAIITSQISTDFTPDSLYDSIQTFDGVNSVETNYALADNLQRISKFLRLQQPNWNGYDADPISYSLIRYARILVSALGEHQPEVFPVPNGSIQLEYEKADGSYLEFEVHQKGDIEVFQVDKDGIGSEFDIPRNKNHLIKTVEQFYGKSI